MTASIAVIGGGATGCGIARDLAQRGLDVTVFERGGLNAGTTGHTHGLLHSGVRYAVADPPAARICARENRILKRIAPRCVTDTGGWLLGFPQNREYFETAIEACSATGVDADRVDPETVRGTDPVTDTVAVAARVPDAVLRPGPLTAATAESARQLGATIHTHTPVTDLGLTNGTVTEVTTPSSTMAVDHVVNATGAWAGQIATLADIDLSMTPTSGAMAVLEYDDLTTVCNRARPPADGDIVLPRDGEVVVGTTSDPIEDPDDYDRPDAAIETLLSEATAMLPDLETAPITDTYWGVRPLVDPGGRDADRGLTFIDHATRDGVDGFTTVVGGKLTTYRHMAEVASDHVCDRLGVSAECGTATTRLVPSDTDIEALVRRYDAAGPADAEGD